MEMWVAEIKLRAMRKVGELSKLIAKVKPGGRGNVAIELPNGGRSKNQSLADAGMSVQAAHRCEQIAAIPEKKFEKIIEDSKSMKTELVPVPHSVLPGVFILEIWHDGQFIATVTGAEGPGVRVISKHDMTTMILEGVPNVVEVRIKAPRAK